MNKKLLSILLMVLIMPLYLTADANCLGKGWRLNPQPLEHVKCNCNCKSHKQTSDYHCLQCGHKRIPTRLVIKKALK